MRRKSNFMLRQEAVGLPHSAICLFLAVLMSFCTRLAEEPLPPLLRVEPLVFSLLSPDKVFRVALSETYVPGREETEVYLPDARVFACEAGRDWVELTREAPDKALYIDAAAKISVCRGKCYRLRIESSRVTMEAETKIPDEAGHVLVLRCLRHEGRLLLQGKAELPNTYKCMLLHQGRLTGTELFLNSGNISVEVYDRGVKDSIDIQLLTLDPVLENYQLAVAIEQSRKVWPGEMSLFAGYYNGALPSYSNIQNGVGIFGSYLIETCRLPIETELP